MSKSPFWEPPPKTPQKLRDNYVVEQEGHNVYLSAKRLLCDFCTGEPVTHTIHAGTFDMPMTGGVSVGDWAACAECAAYLIRKDWDGLCVRVLHSFPTEDHPSVQGYLVELYRRLRQHMTGISEDGKS